MRFNSKPAEFNTFLFHETPVRVHLKTDDGTIWVAAKDACDVLKLSNLTYFTNKLNPKNVHHHKTITPNGCIKLVWYNLAAIKELIESTTCFNGAEFLTWLHSTVKPNSQTSSSRFPFLEPVTIEKSTAVKLRDVFSELIAQGVFKDNNYRN